MHIKRMAQAVGVCMALLAQQAQAQENSAGKVEFSPLNVSGETVSVEQQALERPGAVSARGPDTRLQSVDQIVRGMPGTFTQIDPGQGAISVNIRGLSGMGRVNMMVDGVTQNYYGSAPSDVSHGGVPGSQFGTLIDPNFIIGVDVSRGNAVGSDGINALGGSANFRTIGVDDVVFAGEKTGARTKMSAGSNGVGRSAMLAVGMKNPAFDGGSVGFLAASSASVIGNNYKNGKGADSEEFGFGYNRFYKQKPKSQLLKLDLKLSDFHALELSARDYRNTFTRRDIQSNDYYVKYHYTPFSELIDLNVIASSSRGNQKYMPEALMNFVNTNAANRADAVDINNTSSFRLAGGDALVTVGGKLMRNEYSKHVESLVQDPDNPDANQQSIENNTFGPTGKQKIDSLYAGLQYNRGIYQVHAGLNYTRFELTGYKPACDERVKCFPQGAAHIALKEHGINPSLLVSAQVAPWFQPFASAERTMRGPNPQEVFFSNDGGASMNPFLKGEKSTTYQLGFNSSLHGLLTANDALNFKALYFKSKIDGYITSQSFLVCDGGRKCNMAEVLATDWQTVDEYVTNMYIYINSATPVRTRGWELEAQYQLGPAYARLSYTREKTSQPTSIASAWFGAADISELPSTYYNLDVGTRLLDNKMELGAIIKHTGANRRLSPENNTDEVTGDIVKVDNPKIPAVIDLYASYQVTKNLFLRLSVQNAMDKDYSEALNRLNSMPSQSNENTPMSTARGRTYVAGLEYRF
ncbi:TonB-dependent receptor domain-containing protein [Janthinobacterium sp. 1_2014MBL_MicDiv]|uniref:TonB-dependent receptor domain-containing protein n=1 Tax=Janthinobacterium sp. 1_2014MBL_MicDiv TaxID=1644131 RepID=UPI0008F5047A|nr:TonB-dependent receptor [Janthinobacterium sp. 1_2014MBL_MicDiv]APA67331.1 TonB-dependent receptor [Janthinobacterium sp. 1_2014MBL_MicDiv]